MAVFTKLKNTELEEFINEYDIGKINSYEEILEGIENSNFRITCDKKNYILTIFEKRVKENDLPFFIDLKSFLNSNNFLCPKPIKDKQGKVINIIKSKKAVIISFLEGKKIDVATNNECRKIGKITADMHSLTSNFKHKRENSLGLKEWKEIFNKCKKINNKQFDVIFNILENELLFLEKNWPSNLPSGIIHADLFRDNVFFNGGNISGIIDFYFSCFDFLIYDIAIIINDWCFDLNKKSINLDLFNSVISGYNSERKIIQAEIDSFNLLCRAAAVRILVTRLHDYLFHPEGAVVVKKDPFEYYYILEWHQKNTLEIYD